MVMSEPFQALAETEFRLLKIHKGSKREDLSCSFETCDVETGNHTYTAISYAWGSPEDPHFTCYVGGLPFSIRQNAYNILRILQEAERDVLVWLDALCINQKDKTEKSAQIRLMYKIYKGAQSTAIWLGAADDSTEHVLNYANTLDVAKIMNENESSTRFNQRTKSFLLDELASHPERNNLVNGIARLFHAIWFSRVWIRQEGAVGGDPYALRGPYAFTWAQLTALAFLFQPRYTMNWPDWVDFRYNEVEPSLTTVFSINGYRSRVTNLQDKTTRVATPLFSNLVQARASLTEKPHDKVYALSSMASDVERESNELFLKPNYHLSWQEVYVSTAKFFFSQHLNDWQVLEQAGLIHQGVNSDLPSWVPDWRYDALTQFIPLFEWAAGGNRGHVKTRVLDLNKKERQRLLTYNGFASIMPLCGTLGKYGQEQARDQVRRRDSNSVKQEDHGQLEENLHIQERWLQKRKSALRAALVLEISVSMQDKVTYVCPKSMWFFETELRASREAIIKCDKQNLRFLESLKEDQYITSESLVTAYNKTLISSQDSEDSYASGDIDALARDWRKWLEDGDLTHPPPYHSAIENSWAFRDHSFVWTESGYMALVPCFTQLGDHIVVFPGYQMPFVVRPVLEWYMLIGMCYVHGMMRGDAGILIEEFDIKFQDGKVNIKRPQGDVRANGKKHDAGRYVDILETLGKRSVRLI